MRPDPDLHRLPRRQPRPPLRLALPRQSMAAGEPALASAFRQFIGQSGFPCVGAKAALARDGIEIMLCQSMTSAWDDVAIAQRLVAFAQRWRRRPELFQSLVVIFKGPRHLSERQYEAALWQRLQSLSDKDGWLGQRVAPGISADPANAHFALSFGGTAFFAVGLHPHASRKARRFAAPAIVFNLHGQFQRLRADGRYEGMRETILTRDAAWSGSINPMLARHGETSEARQYSGRIVEGDWQCPFRRRQ